MTLLIGFGIGLCGLNHVTYVLALFSYFDNETYFSSESAERRQMRCMLPFFFSALVFCLTYTLTGTHRLIHGGVEFFLSDTLPANIIERSLTFDFYYLPTEALLFRHRGILSAATVLMPLITLLECFALFSLIHAGYRRVFVGAVFAMHAFSALFMGMLFWQNMLLLALLWDGGSRLKFKPIFSQDVSSARGGA